MTDKELLELAARAAGLPECGWMGPVFVYVKDNTFTEWGPLTDDGDALRLAVELNLLVDCASACARPLPDSIPWQEGVGDDGYEATRRAIVQAAAKIGEQMP